jgi:hypothetical protein
MVNQWLMFRPVWAPLGRMLVPHPGRLTPVEPGRGGRIEPLRRRGGIHH